MSAKFREKSILGSFFFEITPHSGRVHKGGGDKIVPKRLQGCSMDMLPAHMVKEKRACMPICVLFLFGLETHFITKFPYF